MLFINFKILRAIINLGDNLKDKQAYKKNLGPSVKIFPGNNSKLEMMTIRDYPGRCLGLYSILEIFIKTLTNHILIY